MVSAAGWFCWDPDGGFVGIGAAGSNGKSALSAGHDGSAGRHRRTRPGAGSPTFDCVSAWASVGADAYESASLPDQLELGHVGQLNRVRSQLSDYLAAPYADHPGAGTEPPSSFGAGHAVDVDAPQQCDSRIVHQAQQAAGL
jgi:hypothetical protein